MTIWQAIILGIIQGATEFLPISSSGHLLLFNSIFDISDNFLGLSIFLHIATLFAVLIVLRKQIWWLIKNPFSKLALKLYLSTIITIIIAIPIKLFFNDLLNGAFLPIFFLLTAILLLLTEFLSSKTISHSLGFKTAVYIGIIQGIAVIPGISRSGSTICAGVLEGVKREDCAEFSFILSIPIILASMIFQVVECIETNQPFFDTSILNIVLSFVFALLVGLICVKFMINTVKKVKFYPFVIYLTILSISCLFIL